GQKLTAAGMQTAQQIMIRRVDKIGVASPNVAVQGGDEIVIQLAGIHDPAKAAAIVGQTGKLYFFDFEQDLASPTVSQGQAVAVPAHRLAISSPGGQLWYLFKYFPKRADGPPELTGNDLVESGISAQPDPNTNQPVVLLQFTGHGAKEFQRITKAEYQRGK